jgi:hypothetical protein
MTWTQWTAAPTGNWQGCAMDSANSIRIALMDNGNAWISKAAVNGGAFVSTGAIANWARVALSSSGNLALAVTGFTTGTVETSSNTLSANPPTWTTANPPAGNWRAACMSADGTKQYVAQWGGTVWKSTNSGATFSATTTAPFNYIYNLACSPDGETLLAISQTSDVYSSRDGGLTWVSEAGAPGTPPQMGT